MSRKGQSITLSISDEDKSQLEAIARELGVMRGERPNISALVEAIARQQFLVAPNNNWSENRIRVLAQAIQTLTDTGQLEDAQVIANLLLERSEVSLPLRKQIERFLKTPPPTWRLEIERYILRQQPFQISYHDAADRFWSFSIRYAQIALHERRQYLDCWCDETEGNQDLPELIHNWCLRLDRIPEAAIVPIEGKWHSSLDWIEVEMHLFSGLAFAYQAKPEDNINEWILDKSRVRRVVRRVSSTFWFSREVMQYAPDCVVISPENVRDRLKQKLLTLCQLYDIETRS
ncbi:MULTISPECIES: WYL domain-containing protein [unclassified Nostoc]|uniref:WYL domain-containing protein n=1 Tax=unclassified Nostoc TaxID=2593658 RepID=UPI002AD4CA3F|nr:WYL domain-containing protein [Nostoc sp. DedQUE03]MDZ7977427.1 WYL domain-containing protein [Nostoc sp. DedQUE03]MDZ8043637.1 WYL domain-containing protein [Nostoc sp. DedQUE02]